MKSDPILGGSSFVKYPLLKQGVYHTVAKYLKAKEELWKLKYFTMQKYNLQKIL